MRVIFHLLCGMAVMGLSRTPVLAQAVPVFVPRLPAVRPTAQTATVALVGKLPKGTEKSAVVFEVDAARPTGKPAFKLWRGVTLTERHSEPEAFGAWGKILTASSADFVRVQTYGTTAKAITASVGTLLPRLKQAGLSVILTFETSPEKPVGWREEITQAVQTLSAANFGVVRWELKGSAENLLRDYPDFARVVRRAAPSAPVGIYSEAPLTGTPAQISLAQAIVRQKLGCDSLAWRADPNSVTFARQLTATRKTLERFPAMKNATLWADFEQMTPQTAEAAWGIMQPLASASLPNAAAGMTFTASSVLRSDNSLTPSGTLIALHQRMGGMTLPVTSNNTTAMLSAAQEGRGFSLLVLGLGDKGGSPIPVTIRLKNLPNLPASAWRVTRYDALSIWAETADKKSKAASGLRPSGIADSAVAEQLDITLAGGSDAPVLLECKPSPTLPMRVELTGDRWFCRAGETLTADAYITNLMPKAWNGKAELTGTLAGLITAGLKSAPTGKMEQGKLHLLRYQIKVPAVANETRACLNLVVNGVRASQEIVILAPVGVALMTPRMDLDAPGGKADFQVLLSNRASSDLTLTLKAGEDLFPIILDKGKSAVQTLSLGVKERDAGVYPINITVNNGQEKLTEVQAWLGVPYWCRYAILKPNIDGDLREWTDASAMGMGRQEQVRGKAWRGATDLSAYAYAKWDESFFYLACAVTDDFTVAPSVDAIASTGDSLTFALTPDPLVVNAEKGYSANDMEFCFALTGDGQTHLLRTHGTDAHPAGRLEKAVIAIRRTGSRTFYEAAIPWAELGLTAPEPGRKFGFAVAVNDADGDERGAIVWNDGLIGTKRPFLFPPLRLVK